MYHSKVRVPRPKKIFNDKGFHATEEKFSKMINTIKKADKILHLTFRPKVL